jgi:hypothetical protein
VTCPGKPKKKPTVKHVWIVEEGGPWKTQLVCP